MQRTLAGLECALQQKQEKLELLCTDLDKIRDANTTLDDALTRMLRMEFDLSEQLAAIRPELDGKAIMEHLGLSPGREIGEALDFLLEIRLEEGLIGDTESKARLDAWWSQRSS